MVEIKCNICRDLMFLCKHLDKFITKPSLVICKACEDKGQLIPTLMAKYSLEKKDKKIKEKVKPEIVLPREEVNEEFVFTLLLTQNVRRLVNRFKAFMDKVQAQQPTMARNVERCISNIRDQAEKQVSSIIAGETRELLGLIESQDKANQRSISQVEQLKQRLRDRMGELRAVNRNGEQGELLFDAEQAIESMRVLDSKISWINAKHMQMGELIGQARNIMTYGQL